MGGHDTGVDDVGGDAGASGLVEDVAGLAGVGVGQTDEAGRGVGLGDGGGELDLGVLLDVGDLVGAHDGHDEAVVGLHGHGAPAVHLEGLGGGGELTAVECALADVTLLDGGDEGLLLHVDGVIVERVVVDDDVLVGDEVQGVEVRDGNAHEGVGGTGRAGAAADVEGGGEDNGGQDSRNEGGNSANHVGRDVDVNGGVVDMWQGEDTGES